MHPTTPHHSKAPGGEKRDDKGGKCRTAHLQYTGKGKTKHYNYMTYNANTPHCLGSYVSPSMEVTQFSTENGFAQSAETFSGVSNEAYTVENDFDW